MHREVDFGKYRNIYDLVKDEIHKVNVNGTKITTRVVTSINGSKDVLLVVNGTYVQDISFIHPANVKSLRYLSAMQASKYGAIGANGAIEITLK